MIRIGLLAGAAALALGACTASVGTDIDGDAAVATDINGTFVPANDFIAVAQTRRPVVAYGNTRGYWRYGDRGRMYFVSGGRSVPGRWYVRGDRYCTQYGALPDRCYRIYRTADGRYALYDDDNEIWARISF